MLFLHINTQKIKLIMIVVAIIATAGIFFISYYINKNKNITQSKAYSDNNAQSAGIGKYSMRDRFGVGFPTQKYSIVKEKIVTKLRSIDELPRKSLQQLGVGWYHDWTGGKLSDGIIGGKRENLQFMGLVGGYSQTKNSPQTIESPVCQDLKNFILSNRDKFPEDMEWIIGNEIGLDDGKLTASEYAGHFINWKKCLLYIDSTFRVGSGAISQLQKSTPDPQGTPHCVGLNDPRSGAKYFEDYIKEIKKIDSTNLPDFYVNHGYTYCLTDHGNSAPAFSIEKTVDIEAFKWQIQEYRRILKNAGEQNKDLIIKEWGPFNIQVGFENRQRHLQDTIDYMAQATDRDIGNPEDDYRLVQKWSMTMASSMPNAHLSPVGSFKALYQNTALMDGVTGEWTPMGDLYHRLIQKYTNTADIFDMRYGMSGWSSGLTSGITNLHGWGNSGKGSANPTPGKPRRFSEISSLASDKDINLNIGKIDDSGYTDYNYPPSQGIPLHFDWTNKNSYFWDGHLRCVHKNTREVALCIDKVNDTNYEPYTKTYETIDEMFSDARERNVDLTGRVWEIANEPDMQPYIRPEDYAVWYKLFADKIRKLDPKAKIMIGGLVAVARDDMWLYLKYDIVCKPNREIDCAKQQESDRFDWVRRFRNKYKDLYGDYPSIDIWNFHPYVLAINNIQHPEQTAQEAITSITQFRDFLENLPSSDVISEKNKPLYLTEYGSLNYEGSTILSKYNSETGQLEIKRQCNNHCCLTLDQQTQEWVTTSNFAQPLQIWLNSSSYAQKWYWFSFEHTASWQNLNYLGIMGPLNSFKINDTPKSPCYPDFNTTNASFNPLAITYIKQAGIAKIINSSFESPNLQDYGWNFQSTHPQITGSTTASDKKYGIRSLEIAFGQTGTATIVSEISSRYFANKSLTVSAFAKTIEGAKASLKIIFYYSNGSSSEIGGPNLSQYSDWTQMTMNDIKVPAGVVKIEVVGIGSSGTGNSKVWLDDFSLNVIVPSVTEAPTKIPTRSPTVPSNTPAQISNTPPPPPTTITESITPDSPTITMGVCEKFEFGDANCDNIIDLMDFSCWQSEYIYKERAKGCTREADFNSQEGVNMFDFEIWQSSYLHASN